MTITEPVETMNAEAEACENCAQNEHDIRELRRALGMIGAMIPAALEIGAVTR